MDITPEEEQAAKQAREMIERLLRPREEIIAERRVAAQELAQALGLDHLSSPMFLVDPDTPLTLSEASPQTQRTFFDEVQKSIKLQRELARLRAEHEAAVSTTKPALSSARADAERKLLEEEIECNKLEKERKRLEAIKRHYDELNSQPAATPGFLDHNVMFKDCAPFPELPKELIEGFTKDHDPPDEEIKDLVSKLRKATLREKLVLEQDRRKLEGLKANNPIDPKALSPKSQVVALNAVKDSLVNWIETMLSKVGESESEEAVDSSSKKDDSEDFDRDAQLAEIEKEYKRHLELRKQIMASMSQLRKLKEMPRPRRERAPELPSEAPLPARHEPQTYLLTPYLEKLQALSRDQKGLVQEKAHINATIARQQQDTNKALRRLTQESELLSNHAAPAPEQSQSGSSFAKATKRSSVTEQIKPWLFAADSAKIATLEAVAEAVDKGQMSIEDAVQALDQVSMLQNKGHIDIPDDGEARSLEPDTKPEEAGESSNAGAERTEKKTTKEQQKSIWSVLDGNLGLINE